MSSRSYIELDREEVEAIAVELGAISPSESSFEMGSPPFALYGRVIDKLRAALTPQENDEAASMSTSDGLGA